MRTGAEPPGKRTTSKVPASASSAVSISGAALQVAALSAPRTLLAVSPAPRAERGDGDEARAEARARAALVWLMPGLGRLGSAVFPLLWQQC
jgi:hypothetical protein